MFFRLRFFVCSGSGWDSAASNSDIVRAENLLVSDLLRGRGGPPRELDLLSGSWRNMKPVVRRHGRPSKARPELRPGALVQLVRKRSNGGHGTNKHSWSTYATFSDHRPRQTPAQTSLDCRGSIGCPGDAAICRRGLPRQQRDQSVQLLGAFVRDMLTKSRRPICPPVQMNLPCRGDGP